MFILGVRVVGEEVLGIIDIIIGLIELGNIRCNFFINIFFNIIINIKFYFGGV